jgi:hypothetical protein
MTEQDLIDLLTKVVDPKPVFYRLYYDETGFPLFYSMEDLPGTYIEIDCETFTKGASNIRVRSGKIVEVTWKTNTVLEPSDSGVACHPDDISIVVSRTDPHQCWSKKTYETN